MKHAVDWYKYANAPRNRLAANGSLYLVTGCEKPLLGASHHFRTAMVLYPHRENCRTAAIEQNHFERERVRRMTPALPQNLLVDVERNVKLPNNETST